jgi:hypothetical protein
MDKPEVYPTGEPHFVIVYSLLKHYIMIVYNLLVSDVTIGYII